MAFALLVQVFLTIQCWSAIDADQGNPLQKLLRFISNKQQQGQGGADAERTPAGKGAAGSSMAGASVDDVVSESHFENPLHTFWKHVTLAPALGVWYGWGVCG
jgi:hypothetical protein